MFEEMNNLQQYPLAVSQRAAMIKLVIFDVDGVLTDGRLYFDDHGTEFKAFHSRDGLGMNMLQKTGIPIAIITGRTSQVVLHRMKNLGVKHIFQGQLEKIHAFNELLTQFSLPAEQVAYVGDDLIDLPVMKACGLAVATADAHSLVKKHAHWCTHQPGGRGAARDVCELLITTQSNWHLVAGTAN
jgi:3-deoxy-D-manno-octulosonate 8-phosphate phosphatase (KDO 8-P phosphatase)